MRTFVWAPDSRSDRITVAIGDRFSDHFAVVDVFADGSTWVKTWSKRSTVLADGGRSDADEDAIGAAALTMGCHGWEA